MYSTFLIHKITGWKRCDNVCYICKVWEHPNLPVTPTENLFRRLCDGTPCIPYNVLNTGTQCKHCQEPPSPGINSCSFIWRWMQKWHIFLHYTNNRPRPFHCTELHNHILFLLNILTITRHVFIYINKSIYRELVLYMLTTRYQSINKANYESYPEANTIIRFIDSVDW